MADFPDSLPGIDVASGLTRLAGNKKLFLKLLRHVAGDAENTKEKLNTAIMEGNSSAVREIAHSMKGSSSNLSAVDLAAAAADLEQAAKADDFPGIMMKLDAFESALDAFKQTVGGIEDV